MMIMIIVLAVIVLIILWAIGSFNGLIAARNRTDEALSDIDVQLKRRYDLVPNLVESVKGYAKHEAGVFEEVTKARANAISAGSQGLRAQEQAENQLTTALRSVFAVAEAYPELKASDNFKQLSTELTDTENRIEAARRFYNANVRDYNTKLQTIPTNIVASIMHFVAKELFVLDNPAAKDAPKVSFE